METCLPYWQNTTETFTHSHNFPQMSSSNFVMKADFHRTCFLDRKCYFPSVPCYDVILLHCATQTPVLHSVLLIVNVIFRLRQTENSVFGPLISVCLRWKRKYYFPSEPDRNMWTENVIFRLYLVMVLSYFITPPKPLFCIRGPA